MFTRLKQLFTPQNKDLRRRILFTFVVLFIFKLGTTIVVPGIDKNSLGTDDLGRDILTRIIHGGKTTMTVGAIAEAIAIIIGVILGSLAGYFGGTTDLLITWLYKLTTQSTRNYALASALGIIIFVITATASLALYRRTNAFKEG